MKAFPNMNKDIHPDVTKERDLNGMDLRDYFAAKAMQGLLAREHVDPNVPWTVKISYEIADAMMEARR